MRRAIPFLLALLVILSSGETPSALGQDAAPVQVAPGWVSLGPTGPFRVFQIATSPNWPVDQTILAVRRHDVIRSRDRGQTWDRLPRIVPREMNPNGQPVVQFELTARADGTIVAFALVGQCGRIYPRTLYRSADLGESWQRVVVADAIAPHYLEPKLVVPPGLLDDGPAWLVGSNGLFRSSDLGATWDPVELPTDQGVYDVVLSPDYGRDQTAFLRVRPPPRPHYNKSGYVPPNEIDNVDSIGILRTMDGGTSWSPVAIGLTFDGVPYRLVQQVEVSSAYAIDGTLVAVASGTRVDVAQGKSEQANSVFVSRDRGASWTRVPVPPAEVEIHATDGRPFPVFNRAIALSPRFGADGIVLATTSPSRQRPDPYGDCLVVRSGDAMATWNTVLTTRQRYGGCRPLSFFAGPEGVGALMRRPESQNGPYALSFDAGLTWISQPLPGEDGEIEVSSIEPVAAIYPAPDGTLLSGGMNGVWGLGPSAIETRAGLPCEREPEGALRAVWVQFADWHDNFGCASSEERQVRVRIRNWGVGSSRNGSPSQFLADDEPDQSIMTGGSLSNTNRFWTWKEPEDTFFWRKGSPERFVDGVVQRFEGGAILRIPNDDEEPVTFVFGGGRRQWAEFTGDAPNNSPSAP